MHEAHASSPVGDLPDPLSLDVVTRVQAAAADDAEIRIEAQVGRRVVETLPRRQCVGARQVVLGQQSPQLAGFGHVGQRVRRQVELQDLAAQGVERIAVGADLYSVLKLRVAGGERAAGAGDLDRAQPAAPFRPKPGPGAQARDGDPDSPRRLEDRLSGQGQDRGPIDLRALRVARAHRPKISAPWRSINVRGGPGAS
jgi:hypothetical protein